MLPVVIKVSLLHINHLLKVEKDSKAAKAGLKRGDQILEVNRRNFEQGMTLQRARTFLMENCHLQLTVRSNLLGKLKCDHDL